MGNVISTGLGLPRRIWRTLFRPTEPDFERVLADLNDRISKIQIEMQDLVQKQRQWTSFMWMLCGGIYASILCGFYMYIKYPSLLYTLVPAFRNPQKLYLRWIWPVMVIGFPILSFAITKTVNTYFQRQHKSREALLVIYKSKQKLEIETLKKKTNYYQTQALLQRYEAPSTPMTQRDQPKPKVSGPELVNKTLDATAKSHNPRPQSLPPGGTWADRLVDNILLQGQETKDQIKQKASPSHAQSAMLFALICPHCHSHNGFLPERDYEALSCYICPKCGKLNVKGTDPNDQEKEKASEPVAPEKKEE